MNQERLQQLAQKIIKKDKWWDLLSRLIDVLRINIFIVDSQGLIMLPPEEGKYGGHLLLDKTLGFGFFQESDNIMNGFELHGSYLESKNRYKLHSFAIPINAKENRIGYMIVGPVIFNRRLEKVEYAKLAKKYDVNELALLEEIHQIRIVSNMMMNSILELLSGIVRDNVELSVQSIEGDFDGFSGNQSAEVQEIYSQVHLDEMLITFLDVAMKMTNTECGSIMVLDEQKEMFTVKAHRGLDLEKSRKACLKLGEGIAGLAAKENSVFVIDKKQKNDRIQHLLKRPEIKKALVMPLSSKGQVYGILNLHTKKNDSNIQNNLENLTYLTQLIDNHY